MSISMPGMGTGLDIQGMAKQMAQAQLTAKSQQVTKKETDINGEIAALEELESALGTFYKSLDSLSDPETFGTLKVGMSEDDEEFFTARVDEKAVASSYQIAVEQLASKDKWNMMSAASSKEEIFSGPGTQEISIEMANGDAFKVTLEAGETLNSLMDKINDSPDNTGVDASVISGSGGAQLTLTSNETGTENAITKIHLGDGTKLETEDRDGDGKPDAHIVEATNARFYVDGIEVESQSNKVEDAITGVTLNLNKVTKAGEPINLDLSTDTDKMEESVEALVESYNTLKDVIGKLSKSKPAEAGQTANRPPLASDPLITSLTSQLRGAFTTPVEASNYELLASIGVITKQNGDLEIDSKMLDGALEENPAEVVDLFIGDGAVLKSLMETAEIYIGTQESSNDKDSDADTFKVKKDGVIKERLDGLKDDQRDIEDDWSEIDKRAEDLYQRYFNELNAMDLAVQQMNASMQNLNAMLVSTI